MEQKQVQPIQVQVQRQEQAQIQALVLPFFCEVLFLLALFPEQVLVQQLV
jgi:hypothetical protein